MDTEKKEGLSWVRGAIDRGFYAPFKVREDRDYYDSLRNLYGYFRKHCADAGADRESLDVIDRYKDCVLRALQLFYGGKIGDAHKVVKALVEECEDDKLAFASINGGFIFPGNVDELQLFRARIGGPRGFNAREMLHLPYSKRGLSGSYRFSFILSS